MRILAAADLHGVNAVYAWLVDLAQNCAPDAVVLAGDLLPSDVASQQRKHAKSIVQTLKRVAAPVLYIMGNDDSVSLATDDHPLVPIHGRSINLGGYRFVGYQYTPPFVGDAFVKPDEEIASDLASLQSMMDEQTVLVTHTPAWGHLDLSFGENTGSRAVADLLRRKPVLAHIHGHIHSQFGRDGHHFNVASAGLCRAMLIELPALRHAVIAHGASLLPSAIPGA